MRIPVFTLLLALVVFACNRQTENTASNTSPAENMQQDLASAMETFAQKDISFEDAQRALEKISADEGSTDYWRNIANDATYSDDHRRLAAAQLLDRYVPIGAAFSEFQGLCQGGDWLDQDDIHLVMLKKKSDPFHIRIPEEGAAYSVHCFPEGMQPAKEIFYLSVDSLVEPGDIRKCLLGEEVSSEFASLKIVDAKLFSNL